MDDTGFLGIPRAHYFSWEQELSSLERDVYFYLAFRANWASGQKPLPALGRCLCPGEVVFSARECAKALRRSRNSIRDALDSLAAKGHLSVRRGAYGSLASLANYLGIFAPSGVGHELIQGGARTDPPCPEVGHELIQGGSPIDPGGGSPIDPPRSGVGHQLIQGGSRIDPGVGHELIQGGARTDPGVDQFVPTSGQDSNKDTFQTLSTSAEGREREIRIEQNLGAVGRLVERYNKLGRELAAAAGDEWRSLPALHGQEKIQGCLREMRLNPRDHEADVCHALAMLAAQTDERIRLGVEDPLRWLYAAWSPKVLSQRMQLPNEQAARLSVRSESRTRDQKAGYGSGRAYGIRSDEGSS